MNVGLALHLEYISYVPTVFFRVMNVSFREKVEMRYTLSVKDEHVIKLWCFLGM
jgi:hypothetical protein